MVKVSVIIPVYNNGKYLRLMLDSIIGQSLKEIEIICVDDGSTDESACILQEYAQKDSRMIILTQKMPEPESRVMLEWKLRRESTCRSWILMTGLSRICWKRHIKNASRMAQICAYSGQTGLIHRRSSMRK